MPPSIKQEIDIIEDSGRTLRIFGAALCLSIIIAMGLMVTLYSSKTSSDALPEISVNFQPKKSGGQLGLSAEIVPSVPCQIYALFAEDNKTTLLYPSAQMLGSHDSSAGSVFVDLPSELLATARSGKGRLVLVAFSAGKSLFTADDLSIDQTATPPVMAHSKVLFDHVNELQKRGGLLAEDVILPDEVLAFMPTPPPAPKPAYVPPVNQPKPKGDVAASSATTSASPKRDANVSATDPVQPAQPHRRQAVIRQVVTQTKNVTPQDDDDDDLTSLRSGAVGGQKIQTQSVLKQGL